MAGPWPVGKPTPDEPAQGTSPLEPRYPNPAHGSLQCEPTEPTQDSPRFNAMLSITENRPWSGPDMPCGLMRQQPSRVKTPLQVLCPALTAKHAFWQSGLEPLEHQVRHKWVRQMRPSPSPGALRHENSMKTNLRGPALFVSVPLPSIQGFRMSLCPDIPGPDAELLLHPLCEGLSFA